jgi:two-component system, sensor histidine kinase and response regulator
LIKGERGRPVAARLAEPAGGADVSASSSSSCGGEAAEVARLRAERDEAEAALRARASFLAMMSHDIREPMNNVLGMARLLRDTPLDQEQRGYVDAVVDAAEALLTLINDILDLSRIDAGRLELDETDFALRPFLDRLKALLETQARRKGLDLAVEVEPGTPEVLHTDPSRLRQVLVNLAGNALKFTEAGRVSLRLGPAPPPSPSPQAGGDAATGLRILVEDTGPGIPDRALRRLFDAYAQADGRVPRLYGGSGLGLMIAHRLTAALGGGIEVRSEEGRGTAFEVRLALRRASTSPPPAEAAAAAAASVAGASLLVVDAQDRTRTAIVELAAGWGVAARGARSAGQALALLDEAADRGRPYDMVLIDRALPDLSGDRLGQRVAGEPRYARPSLILLVASGMRGDAAQARAAGFAAYLPKPVRAEMLLECLRALRGARAAEGGGAADPSAAGIITAHTMADRRARLDVLVVDDNPVNRKLLQIILDRAGHDVTLACDGREAVGAVEGGRFDLVLMDVQMPVMDGLEATRRIRALPDPARARTPIVAVTANAMRGDADACYAAGMDGYVTKPVTMGSLSDAIGRAVRPPPTPQPPPPRPVPAPAGDLA